MATLIAMDNASPIEDAEILHKACKGWGTDEKLIINILGHRNATQRKQIREAYERLYEEDLIKRLESELSGDFERAVYRWILDPVDRDAVLAHVAIKKSEVDFKVLIEISCIYSPEELLGVRRAYQNRYKHSLEEDLASHTSEVNPRLADSEADIVHKAIKDNCFNNDELIRILTTRSKPQLNATFNRYREDHKTSISKDLLGDSGNSFQKALHTTVRCITDPHKYYAKVLRDGVKKMGTDEDSVTRVIVTRAEKDLKEIKEVYYKKNSISLDDAIAKDTSGDYKDFLLALLGKPDHC
ncbi:hypothetical protein F8388_026720 [Cannabis sativa]|uniref:Annexin n=1 Tax=Cannabis sativa TaxID=3483 RepID=A0A7J6H1V5_CANSA|nr:hypothetical protein F8388_026720 [Cannabis sativa]